MHFPGTRSIRKGVQTVQDLQLVTPAIVYTNTGAFSQPYIRGVGSRLLANGLDPSVATYLDGRYISRQSAVNFDLADIERIEVLKGPQGVLFGSQFLSRCDSCNHQGTWPMISRAMWALDMATTIYILVSGRGQRSIHPDPWYASERGVD